MKRHLLSRSRLLLVALIQFECFNRSCQTTSNNVPFKTSFVSSSDYPMRRTNALISMPLSNVEMQHQPDAIISGPSFEPSADEQSFALRSLFRDDISFGEFQSEQSSISNQHESLRRRQSSRQNQPVASETSSDPGPFRALSQTSSGEDLLAAPSAQSSVPESQNSKNKSSAQNSTGLVEAPQITLNVTIELNAGEANQTKATGLDDQRPTTPPPTQFNQQTTLNQTANPTTTAPTQPQSTTIATTTTKVAPTVPATTTTTSSTTTSTVPPTSLQTTLPTITVNASYESTTDGREARPSRTTVYANTTSLLQPPDSTTIKADLPTALPASTASYQASESTAVNVNRTQNKQTQTRAEGGRTEGSQRKADQPSVDMESELARLVGKPLEWFSSDWSRFGNISSGCSAGRQNCSYLVASVPVLGGTAGQSSGNKTQVVNEFVFVPEDSGLSFEESAYSTRRPDKELDSATMNAEHRTIDSSGDGPSITDDIELDYISSDTESNKNEPISWPRTESDVNASRSKPSTTTTASAPTQSRDSFTTSTPEALGSMHRNSIVSLNHTGKPELLENATSRSSQAPPTTTSKPPTRTSQSTSFTVRVMPERTVAPIHLRLTKSNPQTTPHPAPTTTSTSSPSTTARRALATRLNQKILRINESTPTRQAEANQGETRAASSVNFSPTTRRPISREPTKRQRVAKQSRQFYEEHTGDLRRSQPLAKSPNTEEHERKVLSRNTIASQLARISAALADGQAASERQQKPLDARKTVKPESRQSTFAWQDSMRQTNQTTTEASLMLARFSPSGTGKPFDGQQTKNHQLLPSQAGEQRLMARVSQPETRKEHQMSGANGAPSGSLNANSQSQTISPSNGSVSVLELQLLPRPQRQINQTDLAVQNLSLVQSTLADSPSRESGSNQVNAVNLSRITETETNESPVTSNKSLSSNQTVGQQAITTSLLHTRSAGGDPTVVASQKPDDSSNEPIGLQGEFMTLIASTATSGGRQERPALPLDGLDKARTASQLPRTATTSDVKAEEVGTQRGKVLPMVPYSRHTEVELDEYEGSVEDQLAKDALHSNTARSELKKTTAYTRLSSRAKQQAQATVTDSSGQDSGKWQPGPEELTGPSEDTAPANLLPGRPGLDYPIHWQVPKTSFDCRNYEQSGFYADVESDCQAYHSCHKGRGGRHTFLCPNGTLFSQELLTCDWWYNVECSASRLYLKAERSET